jgi:hypothetical protein
LLKDGAIRWGLASALGVALAALAALWGKNFAVTAPEPARPAPLGPAAKAEGHSAAVGGNNEGWIEAGHTYNGPVYFAPVYQGTAEKPWPIPEDAITPEGCQGWIDSPQSGERVSRRMVVRGHVTALPRDRQLWITVRTEEGGIFWPMEPRVTLQAAGRFNLTIHEAGSSSQVYISLILASQAASDRFADWMRKGSETGHYPGIEPAPSIVELASVQVDLV